MCTVTFFPLGNSEYILTSSRDEHIKRHAVYPMTYHVHNTQVVFPRDKQANGTWIAATKQFTLCLLNGAFKKHRRKKSYRMSRGLMLLDFFKYKSTNKFSGSYDFSGIEPFTLLVLNSGLKISLDEMRWDGKEIFYSKIDTQSPRIWSSATLYPANVIREREKWFRNFLNEHKEFTSEKILRFHLSAGNGDRKKNILMRRSSILQTVSITSVTKKIGSTTIVYRDLAGNKNYKRRIA